MGSSFKYVQDFEFPSGAGYTGSAGKVHVKGYARGGKANEQMVKSAVHKHEKSMHKGEPLTKLAKGGTKKYAEGGKVRDTIRNEREEVSRIKSETRSGRKDASDEMERVRKEMRYDEAKLRTDRPMRKRYPVDRREPMIPMKKGGTTSKREAKIDTVMGEFKEGKLHSGIKSGPKVKDRKQAVAIALNEAKNMDRKKK